MKQFEHVKGIFKFHSGSHCETERQETSGKILLTEETNKAVAIVTALVAMMDYHDHVYISKYVKEELIKKFENKERFQILVDYASLNGGEIIKPKFIKNNAEFGENGRIMIWSHDNEENIGYNIGGSGVANSHWLHFEIKGSDFVNQVIDDVKSMSLEQLQEYAITKKFGL